MQLTRHKQKIKTIAVLTSGGDAPGMNAAIRAIVRTAIASGVRVYGVLRGYTGLLEQQFIDMNLSSVANIIQRGGTIIKTDRCPEFHKKKFRTLAVENMQKFGIDGLVVIGGDGTFRGAHCLWNEQQFPITGVPGTIDNDVYGTDVTIGFDTAINTAIHAIDQIRDTASSHERTFIVEVMGRNSGYIAIDVGIGGGAEAILLPEAPLSANEIGKKILKGMERGKTSSIIVVAEGPKSGKSFALAKLLKKQFMVEAKVCILGHVQRGGTPTARDRKIASIMGALAVHQLVNGYSDLMVGINGLQPTFVPFTAATKMKKGVPKDLIKLAQILAT